MIASIGLPGLAFLFNGWTMPTGLVAHGGAIAMNPPLLFTALSALFGTGG